MAAIPLKKIEGKYEILEKLREGGMGAIYKVRHLLLDEVRVIKVMRPQLVTDEELKDRFLREARLATRIRHPNIAHLYDCIVDEEDGTAYIVMEYIGGLTLEDVLKTVGPPPLGLALEIAQQSLRALGYLHAKGMIHRDISPDNLMLTEDADGEAQVKLIDLGIAKSLLAGEGQHTATGMFLGKVRYASPEQFSMEGSQPMDARSDLYSFGLVLYELLTGRYPIAGRDPQSIIAGHLFRQPLDMAEADPAGRISPGLRLAVMASLAKNPEERPQSAQELSRALAPFRAPSDFTRADLMRLLSRTATAVEVAPASATGSTQQRLDEQFRRVTTPAPAPAMTLVPPLEPKTVPQGEAALDEQQRAREIAAFIAEIEATLARGDYRTAEAQLYAAEANLGALDAFPNLYDRVAELRRRDLEGKAAALVESARRLAGSGSLQEALGELRRAHRLDAGNPEIAALIRDLEEAERRQAEELRRAESLAAAVAAAEARLAEGKLDAAWSLIDLAVAEQGDAPAFAELRNRLLKHRLQAEIGALLERARQLAGGEDFQGALKELRKGLRLDPDNAEVAACMETVEAAARQRAGERRRTGQITKVAGKIGERLESGDLEAAQGLLDKAVRSHGEAAELTMLRSRLEDLRRDVRPPETAAATADADAQQQDKEARRAQRLAAAVTEIQGRLSRGDLEGGGEILDRATLVFGAIEPLREQWQRLEELRRQARATVLVDEARILVRIEDFDSAARKLRQALELDPGNARASSLLQQSREGQTRKRARNDQPKG